MPLDLLTGSATVEVSIINPNRVLDVPPNAFLTPEIQGTTYKDTPCLSFLIKHYNADGGHSYALFDLGIRSDWEKLPPGIVSTIQSMDIKISTKADVTAQLKAEGVDLNAVRTLFLSHAHFDHIGDPTRLPATCSIVVGPGFSEHCLPGYPEDAESPICGDAFHDRKLQELDFDNASLRIAGLPAIDWFGDGSFYLLHTPGHAVGHISALARTQLGDPTCGVVDTFLLLAGDVCHHMGELRPNHLQHLPEAHPSSHGMQDERVPISDYRSVHPERCTDRPFYKPACGGFNQDSLMMQATVEKIKLLDSDPRVFTVLSHDHWILDVVDLFPASANEWKAKGWAEKSRWRFLQDFRLT